MGSAGKTFKHLEADREPYLNKGKEMASVTLPYICPPDEGSVISESRSTHNRQDLPVPRNGLGAQGVKNLASKFVQTLFPTHIPFFRFAVNEAVLDEADELEKQVGGGPEFDDNGMPVQTGGSFRSEIQQRLLAMERIVTDRTERFAHRRSLYELLKRLIITGNCLLRFNDDDGSMRVFNLGNYVVERGYSGDVFRIILKEMKMVALLDETTRAKVLEASPELADKEDAEVTLYTYWGKQSTGKLWETWQEVTDTGIILPDSYGTMKFEDIPVMAERWIATDGENYGRGLCEEHQSDLLDLESLSIDIKETSKAAARTIPLVNPQGMTDPMELAEADNLEYVEGVADDVTVLSLLENIRDYQAANAMVQEITQRLQQVFLMYQSVQRDAERVTAEEIRYIAGQLEEAHGGVYTVLADELQRPYVNRMIQQAIRDGDLDKELFNEGQIKPEVITGIDALGRGQSVDSLGMLFTMIQAHNAYQEFNMSELWTRFLVASGIELDGLLKTPQDKADEMQQMKAMQTSNTQEAVGAEMAVAEHQAGLEAEQPPVV
jgi:hypothetical protein